MGEPLYKSFADYRTMKGWVHRFRDAGYSEISPWKFARLALASAAYSWSDLLRLMRGMRFSFSNLWQEVFYRTDLLKQAPKLDVAVYFLRRDSRRMLLASQVGRRNRTRRLNRQG